MKKQDLELQELMVAQKMRQLQALERKGKERHKVALTGVATFLPASVIVAGITAFSDISSWFFLFSGMLFAAGIKSWFNMQEMDRFIHTIENDIREIQK